MKTLSVLAISTFQVATALITSENLAYLNYAAKFGRSWADINEFSKRVAQYMETDAEI